MSRAFRHRVAARWRRAPGRWLAGACLGLLAAAPVASAHESRPAYLEITETAAGRYDLLWRTPLRAGMRLPVGLGLPEHVRTVVGPSQHVLPDSVVERRVVDAGPDGLAGHRIAFVGLEAGITDVLVRATLYDGTSWTVIARPSRPWIEFAATKAWHQIAETYVAHGIQHILFGVDHLLFVFGLLLIVADRWMLVKTVTAFTVAHSLTLAIATLGLARVPVIPLNAAIALSILFLAPEIIRSWRGATSLTIRHPWLVAFAFGLLHGFGFAGALTGAGLRRQDLPPALLGFNAGVEIGQVAFVLLVVLLERAFRQLEIRWPRWVERAPGYVVGSLGAFWTIQKTSAIFSGALVGGVLLWGWPQAVEAHTQGGEVLGFVSGVLHPISGLDHVLAMIAVGLWGAQLGAPAVWLLPVAFPMTMALGGMLSLLGVPLSGVEAGIAVSAIGLGLVVGLAARPPLWAAAVLVAFFAIFHGHAHGAELPPGASGLTYSIGFVVATGSLHASGIATGLIHRWPAGRVALRAAGALVTAAGIGFLWRTVA